MKLRNRSFAAVIRCLGNPKIIIQQTSSDAWECRLEDVYTLSTFPHSWYPVASGTCTTYEAAIDNVCRILSGSHVKSGMWWWRRQLDLTMTKVTAKLLSKQDKNNALDTK